MPLAQKKYPDNTGKFSPYYYSPNRPSSSNLGANQPAQKKYPDESGKFSPYYYSPNRDGKSNANSLKLMQDMTAYRKNLSSGGYGGIGYASPFSASQSYKDAMAYTSSLLEQLNSGRTSYSDKIDSLMAQIEGRGKFSYDFDKDPLFQNALASAMNAGQQAMQDTIGQASALTGGYGSSYATSVGNQAYNEFVQGAYDQLPQFYGLALDAYNAEGSELYNQLGMYQTADQNEYSRLMSAYEANLANAQNMYNQEYQNYWDTLNYNQSAAKYNASQKQAADDRLLETYNNWLDATAQKKAGTSTEASAFKESDYQTEFKNLDRIINNKGPYSNDVNVEIARAVNEGYDVNRLVQYVETAENPSQFKFDPSTGGYTDQFGRTTIKHNSGFTRIKGEYDEPGSEYEDAFKNKYTYEQLSGYGQLNAITNRNKPSKKKGK